MYKLTDEIMYHGDIIQIKLNPTGFDVHYFSSKLEIASGSLFISESVLNSQIIEEFINYYIKGGIMALRELLSND